MKIEEQVTSLELSKRLKELGVKQESYFKWQFSYNGGDVRMWNVFPYFNEEINGSPYVTAAFTATELGEMLPQNESIATMFFPNGRCQIAILGDLQIEIDERTVSKWGAASQSIQADTEADCRARMLIYLIENNLMPSTSAKG